MSEEVTFHDIATEVSRLGSRHGTYLALVGGAIAVGYSVLDLMGATGSNTIVGLVVSVFLQYAVTERLLDDRLQPGRGDKRRYWSMFGSGLLSGLGILLCTLLLVLPGIYLAGR
jgi:hypothetical protein